MQRQLLTIDQAKSAKKQHTKACSDCPFNRGSISGWLGSLTTEEYSYLALSDKRIDCHTVKKMQCAGAAIFRTNVHKAPRDKRVLTLNPDRVNVFATLIEFIAHHGMSPMTEKNTRMAGSIPRRFSVDMRQPTFNWEYIEDQVMTLKHGKSWKAKFRRGDEDVAATLGVAR